MKRERDFLHRSFGIEIEFTDLPLKEAAKQLKLLNLRNRVSLTNGWRRSRGLVWDVKYDSSVSDTDYQTNGSEVIYGGEIASPILYPNKTSFKEIEKIFNILIKSGAKFNEDCGLHIHVDITGVEKFKLLLTLLKHEAELYAGFDESRKSSAYLEPIKRLTKAQLNKTLAKKIGGMLIDGSFEKSGCGDPLKSDHHSAFHFYERKKIPMIEIRMGQSTSDVEKSLNWIKFVLNKVKYARDMDIIRDLANE